MWDDCWLPFFVILLPASFSLGVFRDALSLLTLGTSLGDGISAMAAAPVLGRWRERAVGRPCGDRQEQAGPAGERHQGRGVLLSVQLRTDHAHVQAARLQER